MEVKTYIPHVEGAVGDAEVSVGQMVATVAAPSAVHRCHSVKEVEGFRLTCVHL